MEDKILRNDIDNHTLLNVALLTVYSAFKENDEAFFNEDFGQNLLSAIEHKTGVTFEMLKLLYEEKQNRLSDEQKDGILKDSKTLTVKQLHNKYDCSEKCIRALFTKHNITPVPCKKKVSEEELIVIISNLKGQYSLTDISRMTKKSFKVIKNICFTYNLPFKSSRSNICC